MQGSRALADLFYFVALENFEGYFLMWVVENRCVEIMAKEHTFKMLTGEKTNPKKAPGKRKQPQDEDPLGEEPKDVEAPKKKEPKPPKAKAAKKKWPSIDLGLGAAPSSLNSWRALKP